MTDLVENQPNGTELTQLRSILYGAFRSETEEELARLEAKIASTKESLIAGLDDQGSSQSNQLESTKQSLEDKIDALADRLDAELASMRDTLSKRLDQLEEAAANRRVLGDLLKDLGSAIGKDDIAE